MNHLAFLNEVTFVLLVDELQLVW